MALRQPLDPESRSQLAELMKVKPLRDVVSIVGDIHTETLARAACGLPIQRGSAELIRTGLARHGGQAA